MRRPAHTTALHAASVLLLAAGCQSRTAGGRDDPRGAAPRQTAVTPPPTRDAPRQASGAAPRSRAAPPGPARSAPVVHAAPAPLGPSDLALVDRFFARYAGEQPGASFVLLRHGRVLALRSYGLADLERRVPATAATRYRAASVTKQFTAMAVMLLVKDGKLSYGTRLTDVFPGFPAYGRKITIRHLLRHRSGLLDYKALLPRSRRRPILDAEVLALMKRQRRTLFEPGSRCKYSNSGYAVLAEVVARVSGVPFATFLERRLFTPLGMSHAAVPAPGAALPERARGYVREGGRFVPKDQCVTCAVQGNGGIYLSASDYARWDRALAASTLLPRAAFEEALHYAHDDPSQHVVRYGHGWRIDEQAGTRVVHHSGHSQGFTNYSLRIPSLGITFAGFTNRSGEDAILRIGNALAAIASEGALPVPIEPWVEAALDASGPEAALRAFADLRRRTDRPYLVSERALLVAGWKLQAQGRVREALRVHRANLREFPHSFLAWFEAANCHWRLGQRERAAAAYEKALRLVPRPYRNVFETASRRLPEGRAPTPP